MAVASSSSLSLPLYPHRHLHTRNFTHPSICNRRPHPPRGGVSTRANFDKFDSAAADATSAPPTAQPKPQESEEDQDRSLQNLIFFFPSILFFFVYFWKNY